jgi:L-amino acid N-acyltransferase
MDIREAAQADLDEIVRIYNQAVTGGVATFDLEPVTVAHRQGWFEQFGPDNPLLVAAGDAGLTGFAYYLPFRAKPGYAMTRETTVYIDEACQRQGIGTALYRELIARARSQGLHTLIGVISGGNPASVELHLRFGFERVGQLREVGRKFGRWVDTDYYQLLLRSGE